MQNIIAAIFEVESEGFQAITTLSKESVTKTSAILQMALVKREGNSITTLDSFNSGVHTTDDTMVGGLVGSLVGVLGGPIGVLLMGSYGLMAGSMIDAGDAIVDASLMEAVANKMQDGTVALIVLAEEEDEAVIDGKLSGLKAEIFRYDAAVIADEVAEARRMQIEMERQALEELRKTKKAEYKAKVDEKRAKLAADFEALKAKFNK